MKIFINPELWLDYILDNFKTSQFEDDLLDEHREKLKKKYKELKYYVELYKMYKFSSKKDRYDKYYKFDKK